MHPRGKCLPLHFSVFTHCSQTHLPHMSQEPHLWRMCQGFPCSIAPPPIVCPGCCTLGALIVGASWIARVMISWPTWQVAQRCIPPAHFLQQCLFVCYFGYAHFWALPGSGHQQMHRATSVCMCNPQHTHRVPATQTERRLDSQSFQGLPASDAQEG